MSAGDKTHDQLVDNVFLAFNNLCQSACEINQQRLNARFVDFHDQSSWRWLSLSEQIESTRHLTKHVRKSRPSQLRHKNPNRSDLRAAGSPREHAPLHS